MCRFRSLCALDLLGFSDRLLGRDFDKGGGYINAGFDRLVSLPQTAVTDPACTMHLRKIGCQLHGERRNVEWIVYDLNDNASALYT